MVMFQTVQALPSAKIFWRRGWIFLWKQCPNSFPFPDPFSSVLHTEVTTFPSYLQVTALTIFISKPRIQQFSFSEL